MTTYDAEQTLIDQLLHQFKFSPNILKLVEVTALGYQDTFDAMAFLQAQVELDDYEGIQLDFWGELLGVKRPLEQEPLANLFTLRRRGEFLDPDNKTGFKDDTDTVVTGGYWTTRSGLASISDPGARMNDADYRKLILQKGTAFRTRMTHENLYKYLLAFGDRCRLDGTETFETTITQQNYRNLNHWQRNYVEERGFAPACFVIQFNKNLTDVQDI